MYKPYKKPVNKVSPDVSVPEPRISKFVVFILRLLTRLYLFLFFGVTTITPYKKEKTLFETFERVLSGKSRCIIAFRHPNGGEPQLLSWFFMFKLRRYARKQGIHLSRWPHAVFVYSYYVTRYGGWVARFVMPNIGAMPVYHSKIDSKGMTRIYKAIAEGQYPLAIAPEGQVSYTADTVPRLEPGVVRIGFTAARQLAEKNIDIPVEILPISVHFRFGSWGKATVELLLRRIEKLSGFTRRETRNLTFPERLLKCRDFIVKLNEERYNLKNDDSLTFEQRLEHIRKAALETAERMLGIAHNDENEFFFRLHRVRQICWDRIFLPNVNTLDDISQVQRSIFDLRAGEAWHISRHQELADLCWYFPSQIPTEETALHNKIEYTQNLHDLTNRTMGGAFSNRVSIFPRKVIIKAAPVINLSERLHSYKEDRKAAIAATLSELEKAYLDCINEMNRTEQG
jgi:hypothetical protein